MSNQYKRVFITLKQENSNYSLMGNAMGRCIIESKGEHCKVSFLVQNLKPEVVYKPYIIAHKNDESIGVVMGTICINNKGKGEIKKTFNTYNVEETGLSITDFKVAALLVGNKDEIIVPLVGYSDNKVYWKQNFKDYNRLKNKNEKEDVANDPVLQEEAEEKAKYKREGINQNNNKEEITKSPALQEEAEEKAEYKSEGINQNNNKEKITKSPAVQEKLEEKAEHESESINQNNEKEEIIKSPVLEEKVAEEEICYNETQKPEQVINILKEDINSDTNNTIKNSKEEHIHKVFKAMASELKKEIEEFKQYTLMKEEQRKEFGTDIKEINDYKIHNELNYMFLNNAKMIPFKKQDKNINWIRISLKEVIYLPVDFLSFSNDPFILSSFKKYNHLILGVVNNGNKKEYILGLPDIYKDVFKARATSIGFNKFKCCEDINPQENKHGYWLMTLTIS